LTAYGPGPHNILRGARPTKLLQKSDVVQNSYAVRCADSFDNLVSKGFIASAKNIGEANNGGLQNRIVVRVTYDGRRSFRDLRQNARRFQKNDVL